MDERLIIRHVAPRDTDRLRAFYGLLSPEARRTRFFGASRGISQGQAERFASVGSCGGDGFVALDRWGRIVGHICLERCGHEERDRVEEVGVAVADDWRRRGLGRRLLDQAIRSARRRGIAALVASMLVGNQPIHALLEHSGLRWTRRALEPGSEAIRLELTGAAIPAAA